MENKGNQRKKWGTCRKTNGKTKKMWGTCRKTNDKKQGECRMQENQWKTKEKVRKNAGKPSEKLRTCGKPTEQQGKQENQWKNRGKSEDNAGNQWQNKENEDKTMEKQGKWWKTTEHVRKIKENHWKTQAKATQNEKQKVRKYCKAKAHSQLNPDPFWLTILSNKTWKTGRQKQPIEFNEFPTSIYQNGDLMWSSRFLINQMGSTWIEKSTTAVFTADPERSRQKDPLRHWRNGGHGLQF